MWENGSCKFNVLDSNEEAVFELTTWHEWRKNISERKRRKTCCRGISPCCLVLAKRNSSIFSLLNNIKNSRKLPSSAYHFLCWYIYIYMLRRLCYWYQKVTREGDRIIRTERERKSDTDFANSCTNKAKMYWR